MKRGHVVGTKRERRPKKDDAATLRTMGQAIAATWGGKIPVTPLVWTPQQPK